MPTIIFQRTQSLSFELQKKTTNSQEPLKIHNFIPYNNIYVLILTQFHSLQQYLCFNPQGPFWSLQQTS